MVTKIQAARQFLDRQFVSTPGKVGVKLADHLVDVAEVQAMLLTPDGQRVSQLQDGLEISLSGVWGDRHFGITSQVDGRDDLARHLLKLPKRSAGIEKANQRQLTMVFASDLRLVAERMGLPDPSVPPGLLGENLIVDMDPALVEVGDSVMFINSVSWYMRMLILTVTSVNEPCGIPHSNIANFYGNDFQPAMQFQDAAGGGHRGYTLSVNMAPPHTVRIEPDDVMVVFRQGV